MDNDNKQSSGGLTDEQIDALMSKSGIMDQRWPTEKQYREFARAAIAEHLASQSQAARLSELAALQEENDKLRDALGDSALAATMLHELSVKDGGINAVYSGGAAQLLAEALGQQFTESGAENYLEVGFNTSTGVRLLVTLQRCDGKTPATFRREAEEKLAEATAELEQLRLAGQSQELFSGVLEIAVPSDVRRALDRMCTPLDESRLAGATAQEDARCMQIIKSFIDSLAGQSQATRAQAEPVDQGHVLRTLRSLLDGSQPKDTAGALAVIDNALKAGIAWSYDITPPSGFISYVKANYTGDVHFQDPEWHAVRLWNAAMKNVGARLAPTARQVTRQAAKAETAVPYQAALLAVERMRGCSATYIEDHAKDCYPGQIGLRPQDVATMWAQEIHGIDAKVYLDEAIADLAPTTSTVSAPGRQHIPANFTTHRTAWRDAITECINVETQKCNHDQSAYWQHELDAYDRAFARLLDNPEPVKPASAPISTEGAQAAPANDPQQFERVTTDADQGTLSLAASFSIARQFGREFSESGLLSFVDALGVQAAPEEVRNQALEEAAQVAEETDVVTYTHAVVLHDDGSQTRSDIAKAIRALRTTSGKGEAA